MKFSGWRQKTCGWRESQRDSPCEAASRSKERQPAGKCGSQPNNLKVLNLANNWSELGSEFFPRAPRQELGWPPLYFDLVRPGGEESDEPIHSSDLLNCVIINLHCFKFVMICYSSIENECIVFGTIFFLSRMIPYTYSSGSNMNNLCFSSLLQFGNSVIHLEAL